jgi:CxxC motif-containing protein
MSDAAAPTLGKFICVVCPNGCVIDAEFIPGSKPKLISFANAGCSKGERWIKQEIETPMRTISTSVLVKGGDYVCASVRTKTPIPLERVMDVMDALKDIVIEAPVHIGQTIISSPAGIDAEIIATREVAKV